MFKLLALMIFIYCRCEDEITLTTATLRDSTSAKPTTFFRRINVERIQQGFSTPFDLLQLGTTEGRRSQSSVWNWDYYCQLQPKQGNCSKNLIRYYYDTQLDQCMTFTYTGCDGNKNNFDTQVNCERHCKGAAHMPVNDMERNDYCYLQPHSGVCLAFYTWYYYDINQETCKTFVYGGCGGNANRFDTIRNCLRDCRRHDDSDSI
ncbi:kunitz-type serine protease inhibitor A [Manduca sexta]|uniref:BPTI/Kunitz inhibitor domain-containing protein n=1 Tax=Manduca sexta TaxID=7130 RepID=A0A922CGZ0_MANSE|nr:kunitz-type serine protease inhibitor A [Manduca sexta]KAG6445851.1 hypothetical protein O3G_MSEX004136 [Manduca sexta]KAG6445852.1 hypothetical protein O3G_MSEX004136 [Manduca sexta]